MYLKSRPPNCDLFSRPHIHASLRRFLEVKPKNLGKPSSGLLPPIQPTSWKGNLVCRHEEEVPLLKWKRLSRMTGHADEERLRFSLSPAGFLIIMVFLGLIKILPISTNKCQNISYWNPRDTDITCGATVLVPDRSCCVDHGPPSIIYRIIFMDTTSIYPICHQILS